MNIKEAKEEIKNTINAYLAKDDWGEPLIPAIRQRPILLMGAPGIGKTQIMEQIASEMEIGLVSYTITHHTRQSAVGLPRISEENFGGRKYAVTEYTMSEIIASVYRAIRDQKQESGILFLDEINCVSETLAPTILQFLQCKTFGNEKVPDQWIIVCAGNPPEYNKSVRDFDIVTLDRLRYMEVEPDFDVWKEYAYGQQIDGALLSYLALRPRNFYRMEADLDGMHFVTPRGWEDFSSLLKVYRQMKVEITSEIAAEYLHISDVAEDLVSYLDLYAKYEDDYRIEEILSGNAKPDLFARLTHADFDEKYSLVHLLLDAIGNAIARGTTEGDAKIVEDMLANVFRFLTDAFGQGQEMVVFVTELSIHPKAVAFLAKHPCPEYLSASKLLMTGRAKRELMRELRNQE